MLWLLLFFQTFTVDYHAVEIADLPANIHTHVEVSGYVTYLKHEADGDLHIRLCTTQDVKGMDRHGCVVAEIEPESTELMQRAEALKLGDKLTVRGIIRFDREKNHGWWEVHPVREMRPARG